MAARGVSKLGRVSIYDSVEPPTCISCGKPVNPSERAVSFYCPNCGVMLLWRCNKCRTQMITYKCPNCGFEGP
ncbi:MAG: zinc finger domain-containing protein [Thermoprotei archaeon]|nr:zinc finger domain-containing protein [Thermoprotei archaeon]